MRVFPLPGSVLGVCADLMPRCGWLAPAAQERPRGRWAHGRGGGDGALTAPGRLLGTESSEEAAAASFYG